MLELSCNKVLVIGDVILDKYVIGEVNRISPEAPVPVLKVKKEYSVLGCAANVLNNIITLNSQADLIGVVGNDDAGREILNILQDNSASLCKGLLLSDKYKTIVKKRIISSRQQIVRIDYNDDEKPTDNDIEQLIHKFYNHIDKSDVLVISDYNKGTCTEAMCKEIINVSNAKNKTIIVDPKGKYWEKYKGATIITPNLNELSLYLDIKLENDDLTIEKNCIGLCNRIGVKYVLLTRSEKGMTLITENKFYHIRATVKEVYDVSGAGDTVVATLATFINQTNTLLDCVKISNIATSIVISKFGTSTITYDELMRSLSNGRYKEIENKIMCIEDLKYKIDQWKKENKLVVFTNGCFDILHKGHINTIFEASKFGEKLIVAINSDSSVKKIKGKNRPINCDYDRAFLIAAISCVDAVIVFDDETPERVLDILRPNILVKGGDYKETEVLGREYVDSVKIINFIEGYSSTRIINILEQ